MIPQGILTVAYLCSATLFILALGGLSSNESARRGNVYAMIGMAIAVIVTIMAYLQTHLGLLITVMTIGGAIGFILARKVQMTQMPQLVAILHSMVGMAAVLIGYNSFISADGQFTGVAKTIHDLEIFIGVFIGMVTFSGSVIAFGKLSGVLGNKPIQLPGHHLLNLTMMVALIILGGIFVQTQHAPMALYLMSAISFILGIHLVIAIGGADMPVVISMLNSYSGWAAAATGFMLANDLLIVTGALVGSSGAILSYIMCKAMNRKFLQVIFGGGFKKTTTTQGSGEAQITRIDLSEAGALLLEAQTLVIVPGYGMATAQAQHAVSAMTRLLKDKGKRVHFAIHPVAGRMPGHMNVLLAEAKVPYEVVFEMDEINDQFADTDVAIVIGANDTVNPAAMEEPDSPISGMPVLKVWQAKHTIVLKRSMATGYAGVDNPLFSKDNTKMLFGDAKKTVESLTQQIS